MAVAEIFRALGEPTRLEMVERLSTGKSHTITSLTNGLGITRQGARKHLQVLSDASLILLERQGRDTTVRLDKNSLDTCKIFIAQLEQKWETRLEALRRYVDTE